MDVVAQTSPGRHVGLYLGIGMPQKAPTHTLPSCLNACLKDTRWESSLSG